MTQTKDKGRALNGHPSPKIVAADVLTAVILLAGVWVIEAVKIVFPKGLPFLLRLGLTTIELTTLVYLIGTFFTAIAWAYRGLDSAISVVTSSELWKNVSRTFQYIFWDCPNTWKTIHVWRQVTPQVTSVLSWSIGGFSSWLLLKLLANRSEYPGIAFLSVLTLVSHLIIWRAIFRRTNRTRPAWLMAFFLATGFLLILIWDLTHTKFSKPFTWDDKVYYWTVAHINQLSNNAVKLVAICSLVAFCNIILVIIGHLGRDSIRQNDAVAEC